MNQSLRHFAFFSVLAAALFGARSVPVSRAPEPGGLVLERPVLPAPVRKTRWQELALLFAGRPLPLESPFYELSLCPSFRRHAEAMEFFWDQVRKDSLNAMVSWREKNVPRNLVRNPVLYPLSGADYLNAYALFPQAPQYTFIALEAPGTVPDLYRLTEAEREEGLAAIRRAVATVASVNYMKSKILRKELSNTYIPGTLPVFLLLAGGLGHIVDDVRPVILDEAGKIRDSRWEGEEPSAQTSRKSSAGSVVRGLRMTVRDPESGQSKIIIYLQVRLRKEAVSTATREGKYLSGIHNCNTIFKAAVYLLHNDEYDAVREFVLDRSDLILQDDSGVPYRLFRSEEWAEHLFGTYTRIPPLGGIPDPPQQPVLARRFRESSEPLLFPYGYGVLMGKGKSNLMLFVKKSPRSGLR
jgi:hypothetical protein